MPIIEALALSHPEMGQIVHKLQTGQPLQLNIEPPKTSLDKAVFLSLLDPKTGYDPTQVDDTTTETALPRLFDDKPNERMTLVCHDQEHGDKDIERPHTEEIVWFTKAHAKKIIDFLCEVHKSESNIILFVNCHFGQCRSGAIAEFTSNIFDLGAWHTKKANPQIVPNHLMMYRLFEEWNRRKNEQTLQGI